MKTRKSLVVAGLCLLLYSCHAPQHLTQPAGSAAQTGAVGGLDETPLLTESLFIDKDAAISEADIRKVLDGNYKLPQKLRVAIVRLRPAQKGAYWYMSDEHFLKTQQSYLDSFTAYFKNSTRVRQVSTVPELLLPERQSFNSLREAAVRLQADVVVVYSIANDLYSRGRFFKSPDLKAFATVQMLMLDVRTGLVPFSTIVTRDFKGEKTKDETSLEETRAQVRHQAVLTAISEVGRQIEGYLVKP
jgi:hypothetical protein